MPIKPITGCKAGVLGLGPKFQLEMGRGKPWLTPSYAGLGTSFGYLFWYGYHVPAVRKRDLFYSKLEDQRAANAGAS
ncbi:hypothetical protein LAWI1_G003187 [Lachnellula willkommii]|uniref:Cytochrome c oxidase polypeptide VIIA n=1 Tax=Lachnellula willkommii TaxID=215461 RepID=A0A559M698_9HELO|nr:hypothetical protein LAWI1_G003187 [Lachnellula willkommii]